MMRAVQNINAISFIKVLPHGQYEHIDLGANKIKVLPLPLKDINYVDIPLSFKIRQLVQKMKREKLTEIKSFNPKAIENYSSLKIDVLFDNEEIADSFNLPKVIKNEIYDFPHFIHLFGKSSFSFINMKNSIKQAFTELGINNTTKKGFVMLMTTDYLFIAPLTKPYITFNNELNLFADPMFYAGVFNLPLVESEWDETIERKYINFDFFEILKLSSSE